MKQECPICDWKLSEKAGDPRSAKQLRRYMTVCYEAWLMWPEKNDPETGELQWQFDNVKVFRKWIQMKAGRRKLFADIEMEGRDRLAVNLEIAQAMNSASQNGQIVVPRIHGTRMLIFASESVAYPDGRKDGMEHLEFCDLARKVEDTIKLLSKLDPDELLAARRARRNRND